MDKITMHAANRRDDVNRILADRACALAKTRAVEADARAVLELVSFQVGTERFGVDMQFVHEIQPLKRLMWSMVPCTPDFIAGAVNIRGRIYAMMNIAVYLGIAVDPYPENTHALLIRGKTRPQREIMEFCILADDLPGLKKVRSADVQSTTASVSSRAQKYVKGVTREMLMVLDIEKLISDPGIIVNDDAA